MFNQKLISRACIGEREPKTQSIVDFGPNYRNQNRLYEITSNQPFHKQQLSFSR